MGTPTNRIIDYYFCSSYNTYSEVRDFLSRARDPRGKGRKFISAIRLYFVDDNAIKIAVHGTHIATLTPDNILEFVATPGQVWAYGASLSQNFQKLIPVLFHNFDKGRYKVMSWGDFSEHDTEPKNYTTRWAVFSHAKKDAQEYFQHLKLDLNTGKVVNPKDMMAEVDEDRRKQWLAGVKQFRLKLRTMARLGVFNGKLTHGGYLTVEDVQIITDSIMAGEITEAATLTLIKGTSPWKARSTNDGDAVVSTFEGLIKSNSREMRLYAKVLSYKD